MSHHGEHDSDIFSPRSTFYQGPYGRMFRNLPPQLPMIELLRGKIIGGLTTEVAQALATNLDDMTYQNFVLGKIQNLSEEIDTQLQDSKEPMTSNATSGAEIGGKAILELLNENIKEKNADTESKIKIACNNYSGKIEDVGRKDADLKNPLTEIKKFIENAEIWQVATLDLVTAIKQAPPDLSIGLLIKLRKALAKPHYEFRKDLLRVLKEADLDLFIRAKGQLRDLLELKEIAERTYPGFRSDKLNKHKGDIDALLEREGNGLGKPQKSLLNQAKKALADTEEGREAGLNLLTTTMFENFFNQPENSPGDNRNIPAGYTYFLQFITHDITFDSTSSLVRFNDPDKIRNFRTPRLDLDSLYGNGPDDAPFMYQGGSYHTYSGDSAARYYLLIGKGKNKEEEDLPRNQRGRALISDPRNDENLITSQLQLAFIKFHNVVLQEVISQKGLKGKHAFQEAQQLVRWHYQWVILNDFLPRFVDCGILKEILPGFFARETCEESLTSSGYQKPNLQYYRWEEQPFIPVEFSAAVFRFGHSMIRNRYDLNYLVKKRLIIPNKASTDERLHLLGLRTLRSGWSIQWNRFLEFPAELQDGKPPLFSRKIDTNFSSKLKQLPLPLGGGDGRNLATRDLIRGYKMDLPSGQAIAQAMGEIPLDGPEAPLWYYVLREAEEMEGGLKLGPVGGRIVAEVIIGLLSGDAHSFLNVDPKWQPVYSSLDGDFQLRDILYHARMPIDETQIKSIIAR